jgi:retron-type reverse transcriptase
MAYHLTKEALLLDLHAAFMSAKRHKGGKPYVVRFERNLEGNLRQLCDDLWYRTYKPEPSTCFIVERPKKREVFAAQFRDRVVHHLYYNYTHVLYERTFIEDCYSCIPGRGTHYGIERLKKHIRQESHGFQRPCWVLKLDKRGYFMHIDRKLLVNIACGCLHKMASRKSAGIGRTWADCIDIDFLVWLTSEIALLDPKVNCRMAGSKSDWNGLDTAKSLFYTMDGCGLPIGNLTSQLFSNVYLNLFDQFMKRDMGCRHFGRYVDDSFVVGSDKEWLLSLVDSAERFLQERLHLELNRKKLHLLNVRHGVEFLGAFIKPETTYISNAAIGRMVIKVNEMDMTDHEAVFRSINSFLGVLSHYDSFNIRCRLFFTEPFLKIGYFNRDVTKFTLHNNSQYSFN